MNWKYLLILNNLLYLTISYSLEHIDMDDLSEKMRSEYYCQNLMVEFIGRIIDKQISSISININQLSILANGSQIEFKKYFILDDSDWKLIEENVNQLFLDLVKISKETFDKHYEKSFYKTDAGISWKILYNEPLTAIEHRYMLSNNIIVSSRLKIIIFEQQLNCLLKYYEECYRKVKNSSYKENFLKKPDDLRNNFTIEFSKIVRIGRKAKKLY